MDKDIYGRIYCIKNKIDGKKYVGKTINPIAARLKKHCKLPAIKYSYLQKAIAKHGADNFSIRCVAVAYSKSELNALERKLILKLNTLVPDGYNLMRGGQGAGQFVEASRKKIRESLSKIKRRLSRLRKKLWASPEYRNKVLAARATKEVRLKMSKATKLRWTDPAYRSKQIATIKKVSNIDSFRRARSDHAKAQWAAPGYKERHYINGRFV